MNPYDAAPGEGYKISRYPQLAKALANAGADCTWITSSFLHWRYRQRDLASVPIASLPYNIEFIKTPGYQPGISIARLKFLRGFANGFKKWALEPGRTPPDIILGSSPPIECLSTGAEMARHFNAKFIADIRDPWPDTYVALSPQILKPISWTFAWISGRKLRKGLDQADATIAVSSTYLKWADAKSKHPAQKSAVVPLTTEMLATTEIIENRLLSDDLIITYVGTLGLSFDWPTLKQALLRIDLHRITVNIIGSGGNAKTITEDIAKSELLQKHVNFEGALPYAELMQVLLRSTLSINSLSARSTASLPNKFFDFMSAGLPVLNSLSGELAEIVDDRAIGLNYTAGNPEELKACLQKLSENRDLIRTFSRNMTLLATEYSPTNVFRNAAKFILDV